MRYRLATPELPPGGDIRDRTSAFSGFRQLYPQGMLVRAHRWLDQLAKGGIGSAREIARRDKFDASAVSHMIRLAFLAPDIVEAVFAGRQPVELTPRRLMRGELPLEWHRQRRVLGFST